MIIARASTNLNCEEEGQQVTTVWGLLSSL